MLTYRFLSKCSSPPSLPSLLFFWCKSCWPLDTIFAGGTGHAPRTEPLSPRSCGHNAGTIICWALRFGDWDFNGANIFILTFLSGELEHRDHHLAQQPILSPTVQNIVRLLVRAKWVFGWGQAIWFSIVARDMRMHVPRFDQHGNDDKSPCPPFTESHVSGRSKHDRCTCSDLDRQRTASRSIELHHLSFTNHSSFCQRTCLIARIIFCMALS